MTTLRGPQLAITDLSAFAPLIVVGTRGRTGLARLALGSVAESVASHAKCSVLVAPMHSDHAEGRSAPPRAGARPAKTEPLHHQRLKPL